MRSSDSICTITPPKGLKRPDKAYQVLTSPGNPESPAQFRDLRTYAMAPQANAYGFFAPATNELFLGLNPKDTNIRGTAEHEMNHFIDRRFGDGFKPFGSDKPDSQYRYLNLAGALRADILAHSKNWLYNAGKQGYLQDLQDVDMDGIGPINYYSKLADDPRIMDVISRWTSYQHNKGRKAFEQARQGPWSDTLTTDTDYAGTLRDMIYRPVRNVMRVPKDHMLNILGPDLSSLDLSYYLHPLTDKTPASPNWGDSAYPKLNDNTELFVRAVAPWYQETAPPYRPDVFSTHSQEYLNDYLERAADWLADNHQNVGGLTKSYHLPVISGFVFGGFSDGPKDLSTVIPIGPL